MIGQLELDLSARTRWACVPGCSTTSADGTAHTGITFCPRHGWWPTWRTEHLAGRAPC